MNRFLMTIVLAGMAAAPALAMEDMTCADFTAMDAAKQAETVAMMSDPDGMASGMMAASGDAMMAGDPTADLAAACAAHPDMMLDDAMNDAMMPE
jgi:hypothetical protein